MDIDFDFSDVEEFFDTAKKEVVANEKLIGDEAVQYAIENGSYKNRTGHLRASNYSNADEEGLGIGNSAEYASFVESKGFDVVSGAALYAEKQLKEEFE